MERPNDYDAIKSGGEYTPIELGGHYLVVKQVSEAKTAKGADKIVVLFDTAPNDAQPGYFKAAFDEDDRPDKKWPIRAQVHMVTAFSGKFNPRIKEFLECVEKSNPGFHTLWGEQAGADWGKQFKGKRVGGVFGEVENEYNGRVSIRREMRWFCAWDKVSEQKVPNFKGLKGASSSAKPSGTVSDDFIKVPDNATSDELPFD